MPVRRAVDRLPRYDYFTELRLHGSKKVEGVLDWPAPKTVKEVQAFLGFANFYRRFIQSFADVSKPLNVLTRKGFKWQWGQEQQHAFETLKRAFTSAPILKLPDLDQSFRLETDASDFATGAVLEQRDEEGAWYPVAFYSKGLNEHERNYEIYDKELLAIIRALEEYRHYLKGGPHPIEIWSDHKNLEYFRKAQDLTRRQARWSLYLTRFNFTIHHRPGKTMQRADPLSRRADHEEGVASDNRDKVVLKAEYFQARAIQPGHASIVPDQSLLDRIREALTRDEIATEPIQKAMAHGPRELAAGLQDWNVDNGLLLHRGKVYVPKDDAIRKEIVQLHHDHPTAGHPGRWKTYELVSRNYWWPGLSVYVRNYVDGCDACQRNKTFPRQPYGPLQPNEIPDQPWDITTVDLITGLPESSEHDAIMVVADRMTKRARFFPVHGTIDAQEVAEIYYREIWSQHGLPKKIISDHGTQFASRVFKSCVKFSK
ncbi:Transposon Tf2-8 polyprotein [Grifola frondosa]|uniref:Transposon Tf2-8 polyprotein n=1 Tax=Grifola frondosa TaxID=5627 RepID=A0A1C7LYS6_GRIFR|nr:Transposon Tf2-8 polyprotein [Grifola frondosa]